MSERSLRIAIIGAGAGGLCAAVQLQRAGFEDFVLLEKGDGVGGTWYHNRYPGCECDIPSFLYSFSWEPKADWPKPYAGQPDILEYLEGIAEKYEVLPHCRFGTEVTRARWDDARSVWTLEINGGEPLEAEVVVSALGMFNGISIPDIPGLGDFAGTVWHSARWNWDHDLAGERVAVIGSAASAVQFVPEIVKEAGHVDLFQRTPNWVMPKQDEPFTEELLGAFRNDPNLVALARKEIYEQTDAGITFEDPTRLREMEAQVLESMQVVEDEAVRGKLVPSHPFGCKRPLLSNYYYPAFNRPNLELVTEPIERLTPHAVVTTDGASHPADTVILATGFQTTKYLSAIDVRGRGGVQLEDAWHDGANAYLGVATTGFPNLFMLYGPNTNNGSILTMIEHQVGYALRQIERIRDEGLAWLDVKPEPQARYNDEVQAGIAGVEVWNADCNGYYRHPSGRVVTQWPWTMEEFRARTGKPDAESYETAALPA